MKLALQRAHLVVTAAGSGEDGLRFAQTADFDIITLDVDLPGIDGYEVCRRLKQYPRSKETPVVFISGHHGPEDRDRAREAGGVALLGKPYRLQVLIEKLAEYLH